MNEYQRAALEAAAKQLSLRALSVAMLRHKLLDKGHTPEAVQTAIDWLLARHLLDDPAYACSVVRSGRRKGWGEERLRYELTKRGLSREVVEYALQTYTPDWQRLQTLLDKRLHGDLSDRTKIDKAVAALQRRGFRWQQIQQALRAYAQSVTPPED